MMLHSQQSNARRLLPQIPWREPAILLTAFILSVSSTLTARQKQTQWTDQERPIVIELHGIRSLPDDVRTATTKRLAKEIRALPGGANKLVLASALADRSTEGDFGHDTLQEVATTLAQALDEQPPPRVHGRPAFQYVELAMLVRYEHVEAEANSPQFAAAMSQLKADDAARRKINFTLTDLQGKSWKLKSLRGKVVLINFWATWCQPCRKEVPDLEALYQRFGSQGLVILGISEDEDTGKVPAFVEQYGMTFPVLLDRGRRVSRLFRIQGIPKSFVYDRKGKLVAESMDMRTRSQFLAMLAKAGLK